MGAGSKILGIRLTHLVVILAVPLMACAMLARQIYLQVTHDLSVWKGGGMGMFAGIGAPNHRFLKVFLTDPLGQRILATRFSARQARLVAAVRAEPTQANFDRLLQALLSSAWILRRETISSHRVDSRGHRLGMNAGRHLSVSPVSAAPPPGRQLAPGSGGWQPKRVQIEFWEIGYEVGSKMLSATRSRQFEAVQNDKGR